MLIPYEALLQLPQETLNNLIKEYLLTQVEDGSFGQLDDQQIAAAIEKCKHSLKLGELKVEFSEEDESIAIRHKDQIIYPTAE
ncbi:YheU family protein [Shewanella sp. 1_MG-2023]|uniref:YheU family protein n=1 Tax=Shewanella electrodiphila TaxID=934143 RepID=A0ABT0KPG5_9GAMM|nr:MULTISPECIES: YheU family protein [Shewanella]MCC4834139.1 YheU family protein [Shewanella sp. 10N.7]MCL1045638.1 YheU family protein [Shewanella electrodiphila]MDO6611593.1 YheU family protein [Shewanella sp. 7_MG-2023]MDO6771448.1 YheU family protein [Shewanella sp. 2_MG-2023]MDO6793674.1 YheU family protein [Shewanella sp. 1_MG-2023]